MNGLVEWLFGLETLAPGDEGVRLEMTRELPLWLWAPLIAGVIGLALLSYWRLEGPVRWRATLAGLRALALVLLLIVAAGPRLVRDRERIERDAVAVLLDRSASMTMPDGDGRTREEQVRAVAESDVWSRLAEQHDLVWLGFDAVAYELDRADLGEPDGARTRVGAAVREAVERLGGRPVAGVVVVSDGRTSDPPDARLVRELAASRVGVYAVPLGSEEPLLDLAVAGVDAPTSAFVGDYVPVTVRLAGRGLGAGGAAARVVLIDEVTGEELDEATVSAQDWSDGAAEVRLATRPTASGASRWAVRVEPEGADLLPGNNVEGVEIELVDRPLRVVYFEGYPRWEYRYVKDLLVREESIRSSIMLLATDRRYIQEGDVGLPHVPRSSGEWSEFDVVILGDVRPDVFSREQLEQLREQVAERGTGLVWIAGPGSTPWRWADTPLGDLLPFESTDPAGVRSYAVSTSPAVLEREPAAERLGVLEMGEGRDAGWLEALSDAGLQWPVLRWALRVRSEALKPTSEVLASLTPIDGEEPSPGVVAMRYGAGRVVFVGTEEIWRWRYGRGETLQERFYLPLVRLAGRGSVGRSGRSVVLEALPGVVEAGSPVRVRAVLLDQSVVDAAPQTLGVRIGRAEAAGAGRRESEVALGAEGGAGEAGTAAYAASWVAGEPGEYVVEASDPLMAAEGARARFRVVAPDDELRVPEADHGLLAELAAQTGGAVVTPEDLGALVELVPNRSVVVVGEPEVETLWDKPVVLAVLVVLLGLEWLGRRLVKLA